MARIKRAARMGFCSGVNRAIENLEKEAAERGGIETLGAVVHNQPVLDRMAKGGVKIVDSIDNIRGNTVVISAHGVSPRVEEDIKRRNIEIIDTTCPFVRRAQQAGRRLAEAGFLVVVFGDAKHAEVKGILGWADGKGMATLNAADVAALDPLPRRIGVISQTTQIPAAFNEFIKQLIDSVLVQDSELRIIDTICHDIRERQTAARQLAQEVDLMVVVGGHTSANSHQLVKLCSRFAETYLVETAEEINPAWLKGKENIGVTAGASTDSRTVDEVVARLEELIKPTV